VNDPGAANDRQRPTEARRNDCAEGNDRMSERTRFMLKASDESGSNVVFPSESAHEKKSIRQLACTLLYRILRDLRKGGVDIPPSFVRAFDGATAKIACAGNDD
jgi:hypothetical protein